MIVFINNFLNHHQLPICQALSKRDKFYFIATEPLAYERANLGYSEMNSTYDLVVRMYESSEKKEEAQKLLNEADVVIAASCAFPFEMLVPRLEADKLTFWFSERLLKRSPLEFFYPPKLKRILSQCTKYRKNKNFYLLCAGGYVVRDYAKYGAFKGKSFQWGYFPPFITKNEETLFEKKNSDKLTLLWTARYLRLKHPEYVITAAKILHKNKIDFEIKMLGKGQQFDKIGRMIKKNHLQNKVIQVGAVPFQEVREYMDAADIFLFTSDRHEGWGAVLNESMNSACAVLVDRRIGAVKSIVKDGVNGYVYKSKKQFKTLLLDLAADRKKICKLGRNAYCSIAETWSADHAAERFYETIKALLQSKSAPEYSDGPMSRAD